MPSPELKLDPLFTPKFFTIPPKVLEENISLNFLLPNNDVQDLGNFLQTQGKYAPIAENKNNNPTFWQGTSGLINELENWAVAHAESKINPTAVLNTTLRKHFEYSGNYTEELVEVKSETEEQKQVRLQQIAWNKINYEKGLLLLYKEGVPHLAIILKYLHTNTIPLIFKNDIIQQLLKSFQKEICAPGCNTALHDAHMSFSSDLSSQNMYFRKQRSEQCMLSLLKNHGLVDAGENLMEVHYATTPAVYYKSLAIDITKDIYNQDIVKHIKFLNKDPNTQSDFKPDAERLEVAEIVKNEFPAAIKDDLTPEALFEAQLDYLIPISNKRAEKKLEAKEPEEKLPQINLNSTLNDFRLDQKNYPLGFTYNQVKQKHEWFLQLLKQFGSDEKEVTDPETGQISVQDNFLFSDLFKEELIDEEKQEYCFKLLPDILLRRNIGLTLYHRALQKNLVKEAPTNKFTPDKGLDSYLFPNNHSSLSYALELNKNNLRSSVFRYFIADIEDYTFEDCVTHFEKILANLPFELHSSLLKDVIVYFIQVADQKERFSPAFKAFLKLLESVTINFSAPEFTFLDVAVRYNFIELFESLSLHLTKENLYENNHRLIRTASELGHWEIVKLLLLQYKHLPLSLSCNDFNLINYILSEALLKSEASVIQTFFDTEVCLGPAIADRKKRKDLLKVILEASIATENFPDAPVYLEAIIYFWMNMFDSGTALQCALTKVTPLQIAGLISQRHDDLFVDYIFLLSNAVTVISIPQLLGNIDFSFDTKERQDILRNIQSLPQSTERLIALCKLQKNSLDEVWITLTSYTWDPKDINEDLLIKFLEEIFISQQEKLINHFKSHIIPILIKKNNSAKLNEVLRKYPTIVSNAHKDERFEANIEFLTSQHNSWDCWWSFYNLNPQIFLETASKVDLIINFILRQRIDIAKRICTHRGNFTNKIPNIPNSILDFLEEKDYLEDKLLLLALCFYDWISEFVHAEKRVVETLINLQAIIENFPNDLFNRLLLLNLKNAPEVDTVLNRLLLNKDQYKKLNNPNVITMIISKLSDETLACELFLSHLKNNILLNYDPPTPNNIHPYISLILLANEKVLISFYNFLSQEKKDQLLAQLLGKASLAITVSNSMLSKLLDLHNQHHYDSNTAISLVTIAFKQIFHRAVSQDNAALVRKMIEIFKDKEFTVHWTTNASNHWNDNYKFFFNVLYALTNQTSYFGFSENFLDGYPKTYFNDFINFILHYKQKSCANLASHHNEKLFLKVLQKASPEVVFNLMRYFGVHRTVSSTSSTGMYLHAENIFKFLIMTNISLFDYWGYRGILELGANNLPNNTMLTHLQFIVDLHHDNNPRHPVYLGVLERSSNQIYAIFEEATTLALKENNLKSIQVWLKLTQRLISKPLHAFAFVANNLKIMEIRLQSRLLEKNPRRIFEIKDIVNSITTDAQETLTATHKLVLSDFYNSYYQHNISAKILSLTLLAKSAQENNSQALTTLHERIQTILQITIPQQDCLQFISQAIQRVSTVDTTIKLSKTISKTLSDLCNQQAPWYSVFSYHATPEQRVYQALFLTCQNEFFKKVLIFGLVSSADATLQQKIFSAVDCSPLEGVKQIYQDAILTRLYEKGFDQTVSAEILERANNELALFTCQGVITEPEISKLFTNLDNILANRPHQLLAHTISFN